MQPRIDMDELSVKSLPFVKVSKTVTRQEREKQDEIAALELPQNLGNNNHSFEDRAYTSTSTGLKLDDSFSVMVRRDSIFNNRKRKNSKFDIDLSTVRPSSLEELPPPFKLRRKYHIKSKEKSAVKGIKRKKVSDAIVRHVTNLKRKQFTLARSNQSNDSSHQVVPPSPHLNDNTISNETFIDDQYIHVDDPKVTLDSFYALEGSAVERAVEPLFGAISTTEEGSCYPKSINFQPTATKQPGKLVGQTAGEHSLFTLPFPSPPSLSPPRFNPQTFGIQKLYPREE